MKKKMIILLSAMVICLIGIIVWYNVSLNLTDLVPDEVMEIVVFNGNSGETTHITDEQQIQQAFEGLTKGKTVIMIAHRLSTIQDADQILVMKQGKLAEQGTHTSLVEQNGEYARMWENYTKTTQWHIGNEVKVC